MQNYDYKYKGKERDIRGEIMLTEVKNKCYSIFMLAAHSNKDI